MEKEVLSVEEKQFSRDNATDVVMLHSLFSSCNVVKFH